MTELVETTLITLDGLISDAVSSRTQDASSKKGDSRWI